MATSVHIRITGRVQGVGFRYWLAREAEAHGVGGWVRNRRDGAVEAVLSGTDEAVGAVLTACAAGPRHAVVHDIERLEPVEITGRGFDILPTA